MQKQNLLSRRHALRILLSLTVVFSMGTLVHAADTPFTMSSSWSGTVDQDPAGSTTLDITSVNGSQSEGGLSFKGVQFAVTVTWDATGEVHIKDHNGALTIDGAVALQAVTSAFTGQYTYNDPNTRTSSNGSLSLTSLANQGLVSTDPMDANIPSISIVPPDFQGLFQTKLGVSGGMALHSTGGSNAHSKLNQVNGQLSLNGALFNYVMTFAPKPSQDGSFAFTLVGNNCRAGSATPFTLLNGQFYPGSSRSLAGMKGSLQLLGDRPDQGIFSLSQAR